MNLRKHYLLAGIGEEFQRLDWTDFDGDPKVVERVQFYLDHWPSARANGMGVEFSSPNLGVGKTFGATHIGKELIKRNEYVFFIPFHEVIGVLTRQNPNWQEIYDRLRTTTLVILDEVRPPHYEGQKHLFADMFEETIRHRSSYNLPTIITTNLTAGELERHYPRPYSLLRAKQLRIEMTGQDVRQGKIENENIELIFNDEVRPIQ
jgi:DNA replication protein DnaC